jgi:hypothetical protein
MHKENKEIKFVVCRTMKEVDAFLNTL